MGGDRKIHLFCCDIRRTDRGWSHVIVFDREGLQCGWFHLAAHVSHMLSPHGGTSENEHKDGEGRWQREAEARVMARWDPASYLRLVDELCAAHVPSVGAPQGQAVKRTGS